jgi:HK97 family phage major capsid protein
MAGENEKVITEVKEAVDAIRDTVEKYGVESPQFKEMEQKVADVLEKDEKHHTELMAKQAETEKKALEMEEQLKDLELEVAKAAFAPGVNHKEQPEYKALNAWFKGGDDAIDIEQHKMLRESKTMRMDDNTAGGYLTTTEMDNMIIKKITEISPVRRYARVRTVSKKTLEIPVRTQILEANYEGEAEQNAESESKYGSEQLTTHRLTVTVPFTLDLLGDSNFDLENEIQGDATEAFAFKEGNKFVLGNGVKQPEGILINADVVASKYTTAGSGTISGDDMLLITGELKQGYNPMYGFNRKTLAFLRTLKGTDNHYLWQASLAPGAPNTIAGEPYDVFQDMPDIAVGNLPVIYGDFLRGYTITDRTGMMMIRDDTTLASKAIVKVTFHRWNTGQVVLAEAMVPMEIKA